MFNIFSSLRHPMLCFFFLCFLLKIKWKDISKDDYVIVVKMWNQIKEKINKQ